MVYNVHDELSPQQVAGATHEQYLRLDIIYIEYFVVFFCGKESDCLFEYLLKVINYKIILIYPECIETINGYIWRGLAGELGPSTPPKGIDYLERGAEVY